MFTTGFASNAHSECVFLCVRSSASVCESTVWAPTIGYLCLFRKAGPQRPGSTVWLAVRSLLWRVLYGGFFFFCLVFFFFILPIKCGMQDSWRPFEVCCVFACVWACVCMHVCVCLFVSLAFSFISTHRGPSVETRQPPKQVRWDLKHAQLFFHVSLIPSAFAVVTLGGNKEAVNTTANYFFLWQNLLIQRGITLSANVCESPVSHARLLAPCLLFVRGVFCLDVISSRLFSSFMHRSICGLLSKGPLGPKTTIVTVMSANASVFFKRTWTQRKHRKTQILAPGLKCEEEVEIKENLNLMNMHYWHRSAFIRLLFKRVFTSPQMQHHSTSESDREERKSLFRLKWVSSEIMNMSLRKTKSPTKQATLLQRQRRWQIIVFKSGTAL